MAVLTLIFFSILIMILVCSYFGFGSLWRCRNVCIVTLKHSRCSTYRSIKVRMNYSDDLLVILERVTMYKKESLTDRDSCFEFHASISVC